MVVWPTFLRAAGPPTMYAKPLTPTNPIAMPTGTRSSISTNRMTKPRMAMASGLIARISFHRPRGIPAFDQFGMEDQAIGAQSNEEDGGDVAEPGQQEERPGRQPQIEREHVVGARRPYLVVEGDGLHRDHEQEHQGREDVDRALVLRPDIGPEQVDGDVGAAIGGRADAPEDQHAQQQAAEVVAVGDRDAEEVAQQDRGEHVGSDDPDEERGQELDGIDEPIRNPTHALPLAGCSAPWWRRRRTSRRRRYHREWRASNELMRRRQYAALFCASDCLSSFMMASGSPPALRTLSAHCFSSGSADFFHSFN